MVKHLAFWIGFFAAALLIIPVAVGIWGAADEFARNVAVFLFGAISVLIFVMVIGLFFRDRLLRRVLGSAETSLDDVISSLVKGVSAAANGDRAVAEQEAQAFAKSATGWYVWSGFYRWVVASALGLLLAFGAFTGTVLLFEQNRKLTEQTVLMGQQGELMKAQTERMQEQSTQFEMQNEIMTISLVSELREQLELTVERTTLGEILDDRRQRSSDGALFEMQDGSCGIGWNRDAPLNFPPSPAIVAAIADLATDSDVGGQVVRALGYLVNDSDSAIGFGAMQALDKVSGYEFPNTGNLSFQNLYLSNFSFSEGRRIYLINSLVGSFNCVECDVKLLNSVSLTAISGFDHAAVLSVVGLLNANNSPSANIGYVDPRSVISENMVRLSKGPVNQSLPFLEPVLQMPRFEQTRSPCDWIRRIADESSLLEYLP